MALQRLSRELLLFHHCLISKLLAISVVTLCLSLMVRLDTSVVRDAGHSLSMDTDISYTSSMDLKSITSGVKSLFVPAEQVSEEQPMAQSPKNKPSLFDSASKAMIGFPLFIPNEFKVVNENPKIVAPKVIQTVTDIHGQYDELDTGVTVRPVKDKLKNAIQQAYVSVPTIPKGVVEAILMKESSMGTNAANRNPDIGRYAYLVGMTKIAKKELIRNGIVPDLDTPEGAIKAAAQYWDLQDDKHATSSEVYNKWYSSGKLKPEQLQAFDDMVKYYASK